MITFGAHAFIWSAEWTSAGAEIAIRGAAEAGLDYVEIPLLRPDEMDVPGTRALLDKYGIGATCGLGLPKDLHMAFNPEGAVAFLKRALDVSHDLGSPLLTGAIYTNLGTLTGKPPTEQELDTVALALKRVAQYAADKDMYICVENLNRYESYMCNLASQVCEMLDRVDEPNAYAHLDTYHMNIEEKGFHDSIVATGKRLRYVHLSESDRGIPGTGNVRWGDVFRGLQEIGFEGHVAMESFADVNEDVKGATCMWRDVVGDPQKLVGEGLAFLRSQAADHGLLHD